MTTTAMSLKIRSWKKIISTCFWGVVGIAALIFFIRVATFEAQYYKNEEGKTREVAISALDEDVTNIDETEPTVEEVKAYTVAPDRPRYLTIGKLKVNGAKVIAIGVNSSGQLGTPNNIFDVGWYDASGKPGQGKTIVIDGHNGGPTKRGVFDDLPDLEEGDIITIERGDGAIFHYSVVENSQVALDDADEYMKTAFKSPVSGKESITLITCAGDWSSARGTYLYRQFVRAVLTETK